jgi:hypothetical protein
MTPMFTTVLVIAVAISSLLAAIIFKHARKEKKTEKLLAAFYEMTTQFNFAIAKMEVLGNRIIGFDTTTNNLVYFSCIDGKQEGYMIQLLDVKSSAIKRDYRLERSSYRYAANMSPRINELFLQLEYKTGAKPLALSFYSKKSDTADELKNRIRQAMEWHSLITKRLSPDVSADIPGRKFRRSRSLTHETELV